MHKQIGLNILEIYKIYKKPDVSIDIDISRCYTELIIYDNNIVEQYCKRKKIYNASQIFNMEGEIK